MIISTLIAVLRRSDLDLGKKLWVCLLRYPPENSGWLKNKGRVVGLTLGLPIFNKSVSNDKVTNFDSNLVNFDYMSANFASHASLESRWEPPIDVNLEPTNIPSKKEAWKNHAKKCLFLYPFMCLIMTIITLLPVHEHPGPAIFQFLCLLFYRCLRSSNDALIDL